MKPIIQMAIDVTDNERAVYLAGCAMRAGADWIEVGNPLNKFQGVHAIRYMRDHFPDTYILVDMMVLAGAKRYVTAVREYGGQNVTVTGLCPDITVRETIEEGKKQGVDVTVDLFNVADPVAAAQKYAAMGADYIMVHFGVDQKRENPNASPLETLKKVNELVDTPLSYAVYDAEEAVQAVRNGADVIVVGEPLLSAEDPEKAMKEFIDIVKAEGAKL
ncbi:MAG: orotidine 5'-phosphate decarboxylase [Lachnospiraceae bacterium]|nr:orotidine 5'-phosphate decarboxylase [Lachnospiraceae bacterium]